MKYGKVKNLKKDDPILDLSRVVLTRKLDGTNGRIIWDKETVEVGSRNRILSEDSDNYGFWKWVNENVDKSLFEEYYSDLEMTVFGEFFGSSIQGRIDYPEEKDFRVFDISIGYKYLDWENVIDIAGKLELEVVPWEVYSGDVTYEALYELCESEDELAVGERNTSEGLVVRPVQELVVPWSEDRNSRIIRKVKSEKFAEINEKQQNKSKKKSDSFSEEEKQKVAKYINENRLFSVISHMKEQDPDLKIWKGITGDVIRKTIEDIQEEAEEELDDKVLGKYGASEIVEVFHSMLRENKFKQF